MPARSRVSPLLAGLLAPLLALVSTGQPAVVTGRWLISSGTADTWGHTWGYAWAMRSLRHGTFPFSKAPVAWPEGQPWWIIDLPVALGLAPITALAGPSVTYNLAMLLHIGLGAWGCTALLQARGAPAGLAAGAGVLACLSPFVRGALASGVPEALSVLLVPLLMHWLDRGLAGERRALAQAAVLAPLLVLDGAYGALTGALGGAAVLVGQLHQAERRSAVTLRSLVVALPAALAAGGLRVALQLTEHPVVERAARRMTDIGPHWALQPLGGADLSSLVLPAAALPLTRPDTGHRHIVYVGLVLTAATLWSLRHRASRPLALLAVAAAVLCLGPVFHIYGSSTSLALPGAVLFEAGATNLYRLAGLVPVAGLGALVLALPGRPRLAAALLVLVGLEWATGAPLPLKTQTVRNPAGPVERWLRGQERRGGVVDLPFDREGTAARGPAPQRTFHLQAHHGRPIASGLYRTAPLHTAHPALGALDRSLAAGWKLMAAPGGTARRTTPALPEAPQGQTGEALLSSLAQARMRFLTLDLGQVVPEQRDAARAWLEAWLGPPEVEHGPRLGWALPEPRGGRPERPGGPRPEGAAPPR